MPARRLSEASQKLSESLINISILVPKRCPEPSAEICVDALKALVRKVDRACSEAEENTEISVSGIARQRTEICERTLIQLANFKPFEIAEKALSYNIASLERLSYRDPQQVQMLQTLTQARKELREGVEATKRLVRERCKIREGAPV